MLEDRRRERGQVVRRPHECSEACDQWLTRRIYRLAGGLGIELKRYRKTGNPILNRKTLEEYKDMPWRWPTTISLRNALSDLHATSLLWGLTGAIEPGSRRSARLLAGVSQATLSSFLV